MTTRSISLLIGAGLGCLALCAVFVWPTPYHYDTDTWTKGGPYVIRTNRLTGRMDIRRGKEPWQPIYFRAGEDAGFPYCFSRARFAIASASQKRPFYGLTAQLQ